RRPAALAFFCMSHPAPPALFTVSLPDPLPICRGLGRERAALVEDVDQRAGEQHEADRSRQRQPQPEFERAVLEMLGVVEVPGLRSEEHTSELQSRENLVCRLLLEKKNRSI